MKRLAVLVAASGALAVLTACGSSHHAQAYSGRLYSVGQVERAFASLGLGLHRAPARASGLVYLVNDHRLGPEHLPSPPRIVTVVVLTEPQAADGNESVPAHTRVTRYANVTIYSKRYYGEEARAALSALRWGGVSEKPGRRLIVLGGSIGGVRLNEPRKEVEKAFGPGTSEHQGLVWYFDHRLLVSYWFHDGLTNRVEWLQTAWSGFHSRGGVHVGSTRQELRPLYVGCASKSECSLQAGPMPDAQGTIFTVRRGRVAEIGIGYS